MSQKKRTRVAIVDHNKNLSALESLQVQIEKDVEEIKVDVFDCSLEPFGPDKMTDYNVIFYHGDQPEIFEQAKGDYQGVFVRMHSAGDTKGTDASDAKRKAFVLRPPSSSNAEGGMQLSDWIKLLPILTDSTYLAGLLKGADPDGVSEYFFAPLPPIFLMALAVKLQGFLVVHWETEQWPEGKNQDKIKAAVRKTGWLELPREKESAQIQSLGSQLHCVRSQAWWQQLRLFIQEKGWDPIDVQLKEWRPGEPGHPPWSKHVNSLIICLIEEEPLDDVELAANAYCAIADRLGASC